MLLLKMKKRIIKTDSLIEERKDFELNTLNYIFFLEKGTQTLSFEIQLVVEKDGKN